MKTRIYLCFLTVCLFARGSFAQCPDTYGPNLVVNGDFSAGNTGFGSDYVSTPGCYLDPPKTYYVTSTPCHFEMSGDHTTGSGNALFANGDANDGDAVSAGNADPSYATQRVWYQTVSVTPFTNYNLSAWMVNATDPAHCGCGGPSITGKFTQLNFYVNGVQVGTTFTLSGFNAWMQYSGTWNSGSATSATISITDVNDAYWWNDFGIDDISFMSVTPTVLTVSPTVSNVRCFGGNDGSISLGVGGGTAPYSYSWSPSGSGNPATGLTAGGYSVTVTDAHGCSGTASALVGQPNTKVTVSIDVERRVSCHGGSNGILHAEASGGTGALHYSWSSGSTSAWAGGLTAGTYTVTVIDDNGCTATATATLADPSAIVLTPHIHDVLCHGGMGGHIDVDVSGGSPFYMFSWATGGAGFAWYDDFFGPAGTYSVTVTDSRGCKATGTYTIHQPDAISITAATTNVSCNGGHNGAINTTVTGGTAPYHYHWSTGAHTADISGLTAGTYHLTVIDAHGCTSSATFTVTEPTAIVLAAHIHDVLCHGGFGGHIDVDASGGTPGYTYHWTTGGVGFAWYDDFYGPAGTYGVTITDMHGCTATGSYTISQPAAISIAASTANVSCHGGHNGSINTTVTGGTAPYHYHWSNGAHTADVTGLAAGTYHLEVTDAHGCSAWATYTITEPTVLALNAHIHDVLCHGGFGGHIDADATGGTPGYTYTWATGGVGYVSGDDFFGPAGTYTITVTDSHGCTATDAYTIHQPDALSISAVTTNVSCYDGHNGAVNTTVTGGTAPYHYHWSTGAHTADLTGLTAGTYHLTVTDAHGCNSYATYTITEPTAIVLNAHIHDVMCYGGFGGHIDVDATGGTPGYTYHWSTGGAGFAWYDDFYGPAGTYGITVTDSHGCTATGTYTITQPAAISITAATTNVSCHGGSNGAVNTTVTGGTAPYHYHWSTGAHTADLSGLMAGTYHLEVTDAHGCSAWATYTITQPDAISITATTENVTCHGGHNGHINTTVTGGTPGYSYSWSNGCHAADPYGLEAGTYHLTVTDAHGCTATATYTITEPSAITLSAHIDDVLCHGGYGGHIDVDASGGTPGYTYHWYTGGVGFAWYDDLYGPAGTYMVTVTDTHGCHASGTYTITQPAAIDITASVVNVSCHGSGNGHIDATVTGGTAPYYYHWSNGAHTADITGLTPGTYHLCVTDAHGCSGNATYTITEPAALAITADVDDVSCHDGHNGHIHTHVTGGTPGYTYTWTSGCHSADPSGLGAGTYHLTVTDAHGCTVSATYVITEPSAISITAATGNVSCHGGHNGYINTTVTGGTPGYTYSWSNGCHAADPTGLGAGTYYLTVTDAHGCTVTTSYTITEPTPIVVTGEIRNVGCAGGRDGHIEVIVSGGTPGYTFTWPLYGESGHGEDDDFIGMAGTYVVTVTDAHGCTATGTFTITEPAPISITASVSNVSCHGGDNGHINTTVSGGTAPYTYYWSNGCHAADPSGLAAGTYNLVVTDAHGCSAHVSYTVTEPSAISISGTTCNVGCHGDHTGHIHTTVTGGTPGYTYCWSNGSHSADPCGLGAGTYYLTVTDANGCTATAVYTITEPAPLEVTACVTNATCHWCSDGHIHTTVTGGTPCYTYCWSNGSHSADPCGLSAGTYYLTVTDANRCTVSAHYTVTEPHGCAKQADGSGLAATEGDDVIKVYPNPTSGDFSVVIPPAHKDATIIITDVTGKVIDNKAVTSNSGAPYQFSISGYPSGMYLVKVAAGETTYVEKLILR